MESGKSEMWQARVEALAADFSREMEDSFGRNMERARLELPEKKVPQEVDLDQIFQVETFMAYLVGTMVAIATQYVNDEPEFEKILLEDVKDKFSSIRGLRNRGLLS